MAVGLSVFLGDLCEQFLNGFGCSFHKCLHFPVAVFRDMLGNAAHPLQFGLEGVDLLDDHPFEDLLRLFVLGCVLPLGQIEEHQLNRVPCQLPVD